MGVLDRMENCHQGGIAPGLAGDAAYDFHLDTLSVVTASTCHAQSSLTASQSVNTFTNSLTR